MHFFDRLREIRVVFEQFDRISRHIQKQRNTGVRRQRLLAENDATAAPLGLPDLTATMTMGAPPPLKHIARPYDSTKKCR